MTEFGPFLVLIGLAAVVLAALGGLVAWHNEEGRRIRRGLRRVLKGDTHALLIAPGRGRGAGFNFTSNTMAVAWDTGAWCLIYQIEELLGVELVVDNQVAARAYRGEARRPLDVMGGAEKQVLLRLVFDDPQHADFTLELWNAVRDGRRGELDAVQAVEEGNRWLARIESIFRRRPAPVPNVGRQLTPVERELARTPRPAPPAVEPTAEDPPAPRAAGPAIAADARQELPFDSDALEEQPLGLDPDEDLDDEGRGRALH